MDDDLSVLIDKLLGDNPMTGNAYVARNFPRMRYDPNYLSHAPDPTSEIIDRRHSTEDEASPDEYIRRAFEELQDPRVR